MSGIQDLLIDGYISHTFRSQGAEQYFRTLLKSTSIPSHATLSTTWKEGHFFFVHSVPPYIPTRLKNPLCHWLLDCGVVDRGSVVPQTMWSPYSDIADRRQHVEKAKLQMPIFFEDEDGALGISLGTPIHGQSHVLRNANDPAPLGHKTTIHFRIVWPGYKAFKRQIPIRDESRTRKPITMARFVSQVGRTVDTFLQVCESDSGCDDGRHKPWQIGAGGIQRSDIVLIGAVHVSAGSWMLIMQLSRYIL